MTEGLLWFDNDPKRKVSDKVSRAIERYQAKLQRKPTICYLNVKDFNGDIAEVNGVRLKPVTNIRPHHFLVGVESTSVAPQST
jgi:hypothetical protein